MRLDDARWNGTMIQGAMIQGSRLDDTMTK